MKKNKGFFWASYADLMTALFVVTLTLFIVSFITLENQKDKLEVALSEFEAIEEVTSVTSKLDSLPSFFYKEDCDRFEIKHDVLFQPNKYKIPEGLKAKGKTTSVKALIQVGKEIESFINGLAHHDRVKFIVLIEGRSAKFGEKELNNTYGSVTKSISYNRAKSLYEFWKKNGIHIEKEGFVDVVIAGSGFGGSCRYEGDEEYKNKRFNIQVIPYMNKDSK